MSKKEENDLRDIERGQHKRCLRAGIAMMDEDLLRDLFGLPELSDDERTRRIFGEAAK